MGMAAITAAHFWHWQRDAAARISASRCPTQRGGGEGDRGEEEEGKSGWLFISLGNSARAAGGHGGSYLTSSRDLPAFAVPGFFAYFCWHGRHRKGQAARSVTYGRM